MTRELINEYIEGRKRAWAESTQRSERFKLYGLLGHLDGNAEALWTHMEKTLKPYTRVTTWSRVVDFWNWLMTKGHIPMGFNPYSAWRKDNEKQFKNTYTRRPARFSLAEVEARISEIKDPASRKRARLLLDGGMRFTESFTLDKDNFVTGKGGAQREILNVRQVDGPKFDKTYMTFVRHLRIVGLRPHDLRKVSANHLAHNGFNEYDLCRIFGWKSIATAKSYVADSGRDNLKDRINKAYANKGPNNNNGNKT